MLDEAILEIIEAVSHLAERKHLPGRHDQRTHGNRFGHVSGFSGRVQVRVGGGAPGHNVLDRDASGKPTLVARRGGAGLTPVKIERPKPEEVVKNLQDGLNKKFPQTQFDLTGMHHEVAKDVAQQIHKLYADHPDVTKTLGYIGTTKGLPEEDYRRKNWEEFSKNNSGTYAIATRYEDHSTITLNPKYYAHSFLIQKALDSDEKSGWHPPGTNSPAAVLTHEFGHIYENHFILKGGEKSIFNWKDSKGVVNANFLLQRFKEDNRALGEKVSGYAKYAGQQQKVGGRWEDLARVDTRGKAEEFAEGFAALYHTPKEKMPEYSKKLEKLLPAISPSKWKTPKTTVGDLTIQPKTKKDTKALEEWQKFYQEYIGSQGGTKSMKQETNNDAAIRALKPLPEDQGDKPTKDPHTPVWVEKGPQMAPDTLEKLKQWEKELGVDKEEPKK